MEKICIVKRRQQNTHNEVTGTMPDDQTVNIHSKETQNDISLNTNSITFSRWHESKAS
jgi:hypothetical protein